LSSIWTIRYTTPSRYHWMFQYYLRDEGLALSWIGSGRLIFSHNYSNADFAAVADRFVAAAERMREDRWWWRAPSLTDQSIKTRVLREMVQPRLRPNPPPPPLRLDRTVRFSGDTAALSRSSSRRGAGR